MSWIENFWSGVPKEDRFARQLMRALTEAGDNRQAKYDSENFQILFQQVDGSGGSANLRNIYEEFRQVPRAGRKVFMKHVVRALLSHRKELPDEFSDASCDLLPTVRNRSYYELTRLQRQIDSEDTTGWPYQELGDHLGVSVVYDLPESMRAIQQVDLDTWDVTFYEAMEVARHNLAALDFVFAKVNEGFYLSATGDNYDASRILLLDSIRRLTVEGDPVAIVPNRDTLLVTGSEDIDGQTMMIEVAEKAFHEAPRPLTASAIRLYGDTWESWLPTPDHPLYVAFKRLEIQSVGTDYADQKQLLERLYDSRGDDTYLANFMAVQDQESGLMSSYCIWADSVRALLPRTDRIVFMEGDAEQQQAGVVAATTWERAEEIVGELMTPTDTYPLRYRVEQFPTPQQLAALGKELV